MIQRIEKAITKALESLDGNKYLLANIASKRANELLEGADPKIQGVEDLKASDIAILEIAQGKLELGSYAS